MTTTSRAIVALDVETVAQARALVSALGDAATFYKVGLELYTAAGMDFVRELKSQGRRVFIVCRWICASGCASE